MNKNELHILIERYFNAETSVEEEKKLRNSLLSLVCPDDEEQEALAVMGYASLIPVKTKRPVSRLYRYTAVAACLLVLIAGIYKTVEMDRIDEQSKCIAYVGGMAIKDEAAVMNLVASQLSDMSQMSKEMHSEIENDFNDIITAIETTEL